MNGATTPSDLSEANPPAWEADLRQRLASRPGDPEALRDLLATLPYDVLIDEARLLCIEYGLYEEGGGEWIMEAFMGTWAQANPDDAMDYCVGRGAVWGAEAAVVVVDEAPVADLAWAELAEGFAPYASGNVLRALWERTDAAPSEQILPWLETLGDGEFRDTVVTGLAGYWGETSPEQAVGWLRAEFGELSATDEGGGAGLQIDPYRALADNWTAREPDAASEWMLSLENPRLRRVVGKKVVSRWARADPERAAKFLSRHPDHPDIDALILSFIESTAARDPHGSSEWISRLSTERLQDLAAQRVAEAHRYAAATQSGT